MKWVRELYEKNTDFRNYVDKFARTYRESVEEALKDALVLSYAYYLVEPDKQ